ncbi:hypothetical protein MSAN_01357400 [Mycena sanguinolenta]|uniref:DUF6534 domain-containing protein n=1 Tax=Mycena sanguinolenta TaxID=230812 RepID=A0A8H7D129_9AGAR|nr:hypothetical protein MSAN_01357400 [Mycena sanguinolenta]
MSILIPQDTPDAAPPLVEFACTIVGSVLWGITCMQTFLYILHHQERDSIWIKLMVAWLWFFDTAHTVMVARGFWVLVYKVHDPFILSQEYLVRLSTLLHVYLMNDLASTQESSLHWSLFQRNFFFTYRIYKLSKNWFPIAAGFVAAVFVVAAFYQLGASIAFTTICLQNGPTAAIIFRIEKLAMSLWGVGAAQDVLLSAALLWMLFTSRGGSYFQSTDQMLARLSVLVVNTGLWTALVALFIIITASLLAFHQLEYEPFRQMVQWPTIQIYVSLYFVLCPLYCNTLLANLNARKFIRGDNLHEPRTVSDSNTFTLGRRMNKVDTGTMESGADTHPTISHMVFANRPKFDSESQNDRN